jgi:tetratricopeptide (TPR) repeat protein
MKKTSFITLSLLITFIFTNNSLANPGLDKSLHEIQKQWAVIKYKTAENLQEIAYKALAEKAYKLSSQNPSNAEPLIWEAIILSTLAGSEGGLDALSSVKKAKALLEKALEINPGALNSGAYTSLGALYYQVPGWPLSFGDDDKARENLEIAIAKNPKSIDANFFYAEFLTDQDEYEKAIKFYNKALNSPARPERPLADEGRKEEIKLAMIKVQNKI